MRRSGVYVTTLAILIGCGVPVETIDTAQQGTSANAAAEEGEQPPSSYNFNPGPLPDLRPPPPEEDGGGGSEEDPNLVPSERGIFFGQTCAGDPSTRTIQLTNTGGATLRISALAVSGTGFSLSSGPSLPARVSPGRSVNVTVAFEPPSESVSPFDGNLRITSNDPGSPTLNVLLSGLSLPGTVTVSPRSVSFGRVGSGEVRTRRVAVTNSSDCAARVDSTRITGNLSSAVSTGTLPGRIAPRSVESFDVRLTCRGQDDDLSATMRLLDRNNRSVGSVQLTGTCTD